MKIQIRGTIIPNDYAEVYEWFGIEYTAPSSVVLPEDGQEPVEVEINSYGGDVYSGSEIYTALKNYHGPVTTIVTGVAASMASIIAMAGDTVKISPTGQIMIHNVSSYTQGDKRIMSHEAEVLHGYDKTLANAYRIKTKLPEEELLALMNAETWLTPQAALQKGFVDEILFDDREVPLLAAAAPQAVFISAEKVAQIRAKMQKGAPMDGENKKLNVDEQEEQHEEELEEVEETEEEETAEDVAVEEETEANAENAEAAMQSRFEAVAKKAIEAALARDNTRVKGFSNDANPQNLSPIGGGQKMNTYREAFLNKVRGLAVTAEEQQLIAEANAKFSDEFAHDTTNTALVIPETTQDKIWARATEGYGFLEDLTRLNVQGDLRIVRHTSIEAGDAAWYVEADATVDEENAFDDLILKGHELSKAVTISWKLRKMAMDDFEDFLIREIGQRISAVLGAGVTKGTGTNQPKGVVTALNEGEKPQVANVAATGAITYADLLGAISKVHSSYKKGAKIYANSNVIWTKLAAVVDEMGRPFFMANNADGGVGNVLGFTVKEDASLSDNEILIGNAAQGYAFNVNEPLSLTVEDHAKLRRTDYVGYMIVDGAPLDLQAFALLSLTQAV